MFREVTFSLQGGIVWLVLVLLLAGQHQRPAMPQLPDWLAMRPALASEVSSLDALQTAKERWQSTRIANYVITVMAFRGFIHTEQHTITVKDGKAVSDRADCASAALEVGGSVIEDLPAERYSVDGLLAEAE